MVDFNYKIVSVDPLAATMHVTYLPHDPALHVIDLNLPVTNAADPKEIEADILAHAPLKLWAAHAANPAEALLALVNKTGVLSAPDLVHAPQRPPRTVQEAILSSAPRTRAPSI